MPVNAPVYRSFSLEESSAIANLEVDDLNVEVIFQSNQQRAYSFNATRQFADYLLEVIASPDLLGVSLGRLIDSARRNGELTEV